jgi:hypothetical protein
MWYGEAFSTSSTCAPASRAARGAFEPHPAALRPHGERPQRPPGVLADVQAEADIPDLEHARTLAGLEVALLVEHGVVRERVLVVRRRDLPVAHHRSGVVPPAALLVRMADDQGDAVHVAGQARHRGLAFAVEAVAQQQILRRVAAQGQLRGEEQIRPGAARPLTVAKDLGRVAREIADDAVHLGDRDLDCAAHRPKSTIGKRNARSARANL